MGKTSGRFLVVVLGAMAAACAANGKPSAATAPPPAKAAAAATDPTDELIRSAEAHFQAGIAEDQAGHLTRAREEFDRALDVYLTAPGGAYSSPRLAESYRRTLEAVQLLEFEALAAGDGFTERPAEPAAIDEVADLPVATAELSEETRRTAEEAVKEEVIDLPVVLNDAVLRCIDLYQGPLRDWFGEALARGGRYLPRIREVFAAEGIPRDLAYVALVESAFKTQALSRAKAKGVWQFVPATGRQFGLSQDWWVDERSDPEKSTRAAAQYLKRLFEMFQDWNLALAAYNAGEGRIGRGLTRQNTNDYWELRETRSMARETKNYVPMIHAAIVVAKAPATYGFEITPESPIPFDTVSVERAVDLRVVAECAEAEVDEVKGLNPELRRLATPANRTFPLKVPVGAATKVADCLAALPPEKHVTFRTHTVARGETLNGLARRYGTRAQEIADANGLRSGKRLARGLELIIPVAAGRRPAAPARHASATRTAEVERAAPARGMVRISYRVRAGDTLSSIATRYHTTVSNLRSWNRGLRGSRIAAGNTLTVYTRRAD